MISDWMGSSIEIPRKEGKTEIREPASICCLVVCCRSPSKRLPKLRQPHRWSSRGSILPHLCLPLKHLPIPLRLSLAAVAREIKLVWWPFGPCDKDALVVHLLDQMTFLWHSHTAKEFLFNPTAAMDGNLRSGAGPESQCLGKKVICGGSGLWWGCQVPWDSAEAAWELRHGI